MPTADLRALAESLGLLKNCVCLGKPITIYEDDRPLVAFPCVLKCGDGKRLPTLEEVLDALEDLGVRGVTFSGYRERLGDPYFAQDRSLTDIFGKREFSGGSRLEAALLLLEERRRGR